MRPHRFSKKKKKILSFVGVSSEFSYMYASFEMPIELRGLVRSHGGDPFKSRDRMQLYKGRKWWYRWYKGKLSTVEYPCLKFK